ncbi:DUF2085 domain-containing protein [Thermanaerothrix sp.]|jgi:uncharacterized membrane protein/glutaredoxin|uniref:DUF2085 domain-containing protein n=1 Tax=Thermanaerothrix sp. TaxID=2972675 RepID=UPI002ADE69D7|nr:DUF2085 domain-containing protein [Thermanaerothrix sp.]
MIIVTVYRTSSCPLCDEVQEILEGFRTTFDLQIVVVHVDDNEGLRSLMGEVYPIVEIGPYRLRPPINRQSLEVALGAARDRQSQLRRLERKEERSREDKQTKWSAADALSLWLSRHYLAVFNFFLLLYVGIPFLAPLSLRLGWNRLAGAIYAVYSPLCHQLAFRSWFFFGLQPYYPREVAHLDNVASYEAITGTSGLNLARARALTGGESLGYGAGALGFKVALCQRDVAIYGSMLLFGLVFGLTGRRWKRLPWYLWVLFGLVPIALDGVSQLPGLIPFLSQWSLVRESTPLLRTITGFLFGWMTMWYLYPLIEENMRETQAILQGKKRLVAQLRQRESISAQGG